jgi:hypothetical protein
VVRHDDPGKFNEAEMEHNYELRKKRKIFGCIYCVTRADEAKTLCRAPPVLLSSAGWINPKIDTEILTLKLHKTDAYVHEGTVKGALKDFGTIISIHRLAYDIDGIEVGSGDWIIQIKIIEGKKNSWRHTYPGPLQRRHIQWRHPGVH